MGWQQVGNPFPTQRTALGPRVGKVLPTYNSYRQQLTVKEPKSNNTK
jgi:hypothetical protein